MNRCAVRGNVQGIVQGVGFRAFVRRNARSLGLVGSVTNMSDSSVDVVLCGDQVNVEEMKAVVAQGPELASVETITWEPAEVPENEGFDIR